MAAVWRSNNMYYDPPRGYPADPYDAPPPPSRVKMPGPYDIQRERWSWASTVCSVVSMWFCCAICGFVGVVYAVLGYADHKGGDYERSRSKNRCSWGWAILAIICGIIIIVVVVVVLATVYKATLDTWINELRSSTTIG